MSIQNGTKALVLVDPHEVDRALALLTDPGQVVEVRALQASLQAHARYGETLAGYFDNAPDLIAAISNIKEAMGIYITLQRCHPDLLHRAKNKLCHQKKNFSTPDKYVTRYRWLLVDSDPQRVSEISSTDAEHEQALSHSRKVRDALRDLGWPAPIEADSGNGAHLLYLIDLDVTECDLMKRVLEGMALRFNDETTHIDQTVSNPSRICKLYGTMACKGDNTAERPHRMSRLLAVPEHLTPVSRDLLEVIAVPLAPKTSMPPETTTNGKASRVERTAFDLEAWLAKYQIATYGAEPYQGGTRWVLKTCPWDPSHTDRSAVIIQRANGAIGARCHHDSCSGKKWEDLRVLYEPDAYTKKNTTRKQNRKEDEDQEDGNTKESQALQLAQLALEECELLRTASGARFARVPVDGHIEVWPVNEKSHDLKRWLIQRYYTDYGAIPNATALTAALSLLESQAQFGQVAYYDEVFLRVAEHNGCIYLDLANANRDVVEITASGWRVIQDPPVCFRRSKSMLPLPTPIGGGSLEELRPFLNVVEDDWILLKAWLVGTLHPTGPYPVLGLYGEHGTAKSTATKALRMLIDPARAMLRPEPRDDQAFAIMAHNNYLVTLDNLSKMSGQLSDNMCKLATGAGDAYRTLYENDEETLFEARRPQIFNNIEELAARGDLVDRCLSLQLSVIPEQQRRDEKVYWRDFEAARPRILGALLDAVVLALRNLPHTKLEKLPRMADFALWVQAAEEAITTTPGAFMAAYLDNKDNGTSNVIENAPVGQAVLALMERQPQWSGTAAELESVLIEIAGEKATKRKNWPQGPIAISNELKRLAPSLRMNQISITRHRTKKRRIISLCAGTVPAKEEVQAKGDDSVQAEVTMRDVISIALDTASDGSTSGVNEGVTRVTTVVQPSSLPSDDHCHDEHQGILGDTTPVVTTDQSLEQKTIDTTTPGFTSGAKDGLGRVTTNMQPSFSAEKITTFLSQVDVGFQRRGLSKLFWHVPASGYANDYLSRADYLARLQDCLLSGDQRCIETVLEEIKHRTGLVFE